MVCLMIFEKARGASKAKKIGSCQVAASASSQQQWVSLGPGAGDVFLSVRTLSPEEVWVNPNNRTAVLFKIHHSAGGALLAGEAEFLFFEVHLAHVAAVFQKIEYPWNHEYGKAQMIFGKGPHR